MKPTTKTTLGLLGGVALGTVAGILLAPAKGKDTRAKIVDGANDLKCKTQDQFKNFSESTKEKVSNLGQKVSDKFKNNMNKAEDLVADVQTELDALK